MKELLIELYNRGFDAGSNYQVEGTRHESLIEADILAQYEALTKRVAELESKRRHVMCAYCGESFYQYPAGAPSAEAHEAALGAFVAHDAACEYNPLTKRVAELEAMKEKRGAELWSDARCVLEKRVAELEAQVLMLDKHVEHWAERATVADLKLTQSERRATDLQSQLAWTPVAQGLPTEPGHYLFASHGAAVHAALVETGSWFTPDGEPHEPRAWAHYRKIELP
jgi:uncharacterized protein YceH (UPF0502 family)